METRSFSTHPRNRAVLTTEPLAALERYSSSAAATGG